ncbi:uncharacterized protein L203_106366 [Cryptococcus depauperatus CBS 7841]|uniref:Uncharacterized protein n=1 Tax=Cryptococcus depauperatus CBS 7841 TaxID=1295531 RepID=A0A1E3ILP8_9TREE|nr:hypothetical protein L203_02631 [Cryptococcus depauperatus CBS 7841]
MEFVNAASMQSKSSMRRKQSNPLLQALGKPRRSVTPQSAPASSVFNSPPSASMSTLHFDEPCTLPESDNMPFPSRSISMGSHAYPPSSFMQPGGSRSTSTTYTAKDKGKDTEGKSNVLVKRPEDVYRVVKERVLSWSYMMEWYQGDAHWFNTIRIPRTAIESILGYKYLETRARNFHALGISLSALFDIPAAADFLRALLKLMEEWESWSEGSGGAKMVKSLFRGQRSNARKTTSTMSDFAPAPDNADSYLLTSNLPFTPDFFQVHISVCAIIRDVYRKLLSMFLPAAPPSSFSHSSSPYSRRSSVPNLSSLIHPSTVIRTAIREPFINPKSPGVTSIAGGTLSSQHGLGLMSPTAVMSESVGGNEEVLAFIAGDIPSDRMLVGDGQKLNQQIAELFVKVDSRFKKHFSSLTREADALAKRVLDDQLNTLLKSLAPGGKQIRSDTNIGLSNEKPGYSTVTLGRMGTLESEKERDFGTI